MLLKVERIEMDLEWTVKISLDGRLDANTTGDFEKRLKEIFGEPVSFLLLDLSKLSYISSAGIRALLFVNKELAARDGKLFVTNVQPQIAHVLETIKMLPNLHVLGSDEEADKYLTALQEEVLKKKQNRGLQM